MDDPLAAKILVVLYFREDMQIGGIGLGRLGPTETMQFVKLLEMRPVTYGNIKWRMVENEMEITAATAIMRIRFEEIKNAN